MYEMRRHNKKRMILIVFIVCLVVLLGVSGYLIIKKISIDNANQTNKQVQESYASALEPGANGYVAPTAPVGDNSIQLDTVIDPVDFDNLMKENPEVYAWLYVPDTNISLPVLQSRVDDNYYLDHDLYKNYSFPGAIYSQSMNSMDFTDRVTVLYGHNMADGSMFADLHLFSDNSFFNKHPYFYVFTRDRRLVYQVVSAHGFDSRHIMNSYNFKDDAVFKSWLDLALNPRSTYGNARTGITLDLNSKMLVLSTCENSGDGRFLLQGVLASDERTR